MVWQLPVVIVVSLLHELPRALENADSLLLQVLVVAVEHGSERDEVIRVEVLEKTRVRQ